MADNVVNDDASVGIVLDVDAVIACKQFQLAIKVVNEVDKCCWAIGRTKGHQGICVGYHTCKITLPVIPLTVPVTLPIPVMSDARTGIVHPFILHPF